MTFHNIAAIRELLNSPKKIVIATHHMPDGDAMGSSLGLYLFLTQKKHGVQVITPTGYPDFLHWLPGNDQVLCFAGNEKRASIAIEEAEVIFLLDCSALSRTDGMEPLIAKARAIKTLIDHHPSSHHFADHEFTDPRASSTAELLYDFIVQLDASHLINKEIAGCIYTGIMTDTGSFSYGSTTVSAHRIAAEMISKGADPAAIHLNVYGNYSEERVRLLGFCLKEKLTLLPQYRTAYLALTRQDLERFHSGKGDTEGLVNYGISIGSVVLSALFIERENHVKISFRSKGGFSVNEFAGNHFSGGGHDNAAGGYSNISMERTLKKFIEVLEKYKEKLCGL